MRKIETEITINGQVAFTERIPEEFADGIRRYNFKDDHEMNEILYAVDRCTSKSLYGWCPADTRYLKNLLGIA